MAELQRRIAELEYLLRAAKAECAFVCLFASHHCGLAAMHRSGRVLHRSAHGVRPYRVATLTAESAALRRESAQALLEAGAALRRELYATCDARP